MQHTPPQLLDPPVDASYIDSSDCRLRHLPNLPGRQSEFQVVLSPDALEKIRAHGQTNLKAEVGGVLVGNLCRDQHGPYLLVQSIIEGTSMRHHAAQVTFTADTWADIQRIMDHDHPDEKIVGWYHTHPGFGIFLSEMDLFIQNNFFNLPWQIALVHDPKTNEHGVFVWRDSKPCREEFLIGRASPFARMSSSNPQSPIVDPQSLAFPASTLEELAARQLELERRQRTLHAQFLTLRRKNRWLIAACLFTLAFTLAWSIFALSRLSHPPANTPPATRPVQNQHAAAHFENVIAFDSPSPSPPSVNQAAKYLTNTKHMYTIE